MTPRCPTHGPVKGALRWQPVGADARIRVSCERCGRYIRWAAMTPENVKLANLSGPRPGHKRATPTSADPALRCEDIARRRIDEILRRMDGVFAVEVDALRELLDLIVLAASERSLRYATLAAVRLCDDFAVPAEYRAALLHEIGTWKHADVDPVFGGPADRDAFERDAPGRPTLAADQPARADGAAPRLPRDDGQLPLLGEPGKIAEKPANAGKSGS